MNKNEEECNVCGRYICDDSDCESGCCQQSHDENPLTAYMIPENWEHMSGIKMYTGSDYVGRVWGNEEEGYLWNARRGEKGWNRSGREAVSIMRCLYWSQRRRFELQQKRAE